MEPVENENHWKIVPLIDKSTGAHRQEYFFKGNPAKRVVLSSQLAKQMQGYVLIERDLRMVGEWLKTIARISRQPETRDPHAWTTNDDATHAVVFGLFVASVTTYGKCFAQAEGRRVQLDDSWIPIGFDDTHKRMREMRNKFTAHSGSEEFESVNVVLVVPVQYGRLHPKEQPRLYREMRQTEAQLSFDDDEYSFAELVTRLQRMVLEKLDGLNAKIFSDEIRPKGYGYWLGDLPSG